MNIKDLFRIFDKFSKSLIDEMEIKDGDFQISLKKYGTPSSVSKVYDYPIATHIREQEALSTPDKPVVAEPEAEQEELSIVTSPIVGTFYRAPAPDAPPFVTEGSQVMQGKSLAVIEAMKVMNHLEAEFNMEIVSILIKNGDMVEYGTPLFEVRAT